MSFSISYIFSKKKIPVNGPLKKFLKVNNYPYLRNVVCFLFCFWGVFVVVGGFFWGGGWGGLS